MPISGYVSALVFLLVAFAAHAIDEIRLSTGPVDAEDWRAAGLSAGLDLGSGEGAPTAYVEIDLASFLKDSPGAERMRLDCGRLEISADRLGCRSARVSGQPGVPLLDGQPLELEFDRERGELRLWSDELTLAGGRGDITATWSRDSGAWRAKGAFHGLKLSALPPLLGELGLEAQDVGADGGVLDLELSASGGEGPAFRVKGALRGSGMVLNNASGTLASEGLGMRADFDLRCDGKACAGPIEWALDAGQLYVDPVFLDLDAQPLRLAARSRFGNGPLSLSAISVDQPGVLTARAALEWDGEGQGLKTLDINEFDVHLPRGFQTWMSPFLLESGLDDMETSG
ncbi:MAG: hypothetical protein ACPGUC_10735, partial [Gammaproteobacteria bacterium]